MTGAAQRLSTAEAVALVAHRLADPDAVAAIADRPDNVEPIYGASQWGPLTLANGLPGIALLYAELAATDDRWSAVAHRQVSRAAELMSSQAANGLYAGPAALLAAVLRLQPHYATLRRKLIAWVADDQRTRLEACAARRDLGVSWAHYDVVNGLSGTARLLLDAGPSVHGVVEDTLRYLVTLCEPITVDGVRVPGWWVPAELQPVARDAEQYPRGDFNLGLAHGIAGPLALFAAALDRGHEVPRQRDAMRRIATWLLDRRKHDTAGVYWPCRLSWDEETHPGPEPVFTRAAWCYGAPGVVSAVHQTGLALGESQWCAAAVEGLRTTVDRPENEWNLDGPTVCHGYAGLLQIVRRVGTTSGDPALLAAIPGLVDRTLSYATPDAPFVFPHLVPDSPLGRHAGTGYRRLNVAGMLEGAAGVACALLPSAGAWDTALMLA
ncbi:lanthionine synthetase C family protein [Actinokineospora diospyrosa]|uniref:DisC n=1 Tax=Actinokineospora diospyrosa TaxID=103728 RepID=A0A8G1A4L6_9PSEU|nr:lanthionine synthetase C family protein [Actinokineospora diospyrosa]MCP2271565.1 Lanthionine synthetase C-like protein [Actinokineospora diospyrosa]QYZ85380.1 DisC [Actinokineospora diospyrosa]